MAFPMSCFCDIPISRISEHTAFYGEYGIGMSRDWGLKNGLEPLLYVAPQGAIPNFLNWLLKESGDISSSVKEHFSRIVCLTKPLSGQMLISGTAVEKEFYQESEWRYVPLDYDVLFRDEFEKSKDVKNAELENNSLKFLPSDIKYIFVKSDAEIPTVFDFIQKNLGGWPLNDIKILISRIVSLETIARDL